jgi:hypothetical protein
VCARLRGAAAAAGHGERDGQEVREKLFHMRRWAAHKRGRVARARGGQLRRVSAQGSVRIVDVGRLRGGAEGRKGSEKGEQGLNGEARAGRWRSTEPICGRQGD